jgi:hypothetical protein
MHQRRCALMRKAMFALPWQGQKDLRPDHPLHGNKETPLPP